MSPWWILSPQNEERRVPVSASIKPLTLLAHLKVISLTNFLSYSGKNLALLDTKRPPGSLPVPSTQCTFSMFLPSWMPYYLIFPSYLVDFGVSERKKSSLTQHSQSVPELNVLHSTFFFSTSRCRRPLHPYLTHVPITNILKGKGNLIHPLSGCAGWGRWPGCRRPGWGPQSPNASVWDEKFA